MRYHDDAGGTLPVCMHPPSGHVTSQQAEALVSPPTYADAVAKPGVATGGQTTSAVTSQMDDANREATIAPVSAEPTAPADQVPYVALPVDHVPPAFEEEVEAAVLSPSPPTRSRTWMWAILFLHTVLVGLSVILVRVQVRESVLSLVTNRRIFPIASFCTCLATRYFLSPVPHKIRSAPETCPPLSLFFASKPFEAPSVCPPYSVMRYCPHEVAED